MISTWKNNTLFLYDLSLERKNYFAAVGFVFGKNKLFRCSMNCPNLCKILHFNVLYSWHPNSYHAYFALPIISQAINVKQNQKVYCFSTFLAQFQS